MRTLAIGALLAIALAGADIPLIQPAELAARLKAKGPQPELIHVGFNVLYREKKIAHSIYAGPGSTPAGLNLLRAAVAKLPRDREIVVYCGCCPWDHCPNISPSIALLRQMGFTRVKALYLPTNVTIDWYNKGYPSEPGEAAQKKR